MQALCQEAFQDLGAGDLPVEWVNGVWNSNFCDSSSLPEEVESIVLNTEKWSAALASCRQWLTRDIQEDNEGTAVHLQSLLLLIVSSIYLCMYFYPFPTCNWNHTAGFDGGFWSTIVEVNVSHKSLMALTYCLMERCKQVRFETIEVGVGRVNVPFPPPTPTQTAVARLCATYAAQLYLVLLQMPGEHST